MIARPGVINYNSSMNSKFTFNRELLIRIFFFSSFALLLYQVFLLARPFLAPLLVSTMLVITFFPLYKRIHHYVRNPNMAALLATVCVLLSAVLPLLLIAWTVISESQSLIPAVQNMLGTLTSGDFGAVLSKLPSSWNTKVQAFLAYTQSLNINIKPIILDNVRDVGAQIANLGGLAARNAFFIMVKILILVIGLFFTFRDGERFLVWFLNLIPMEVGHKLAVARSAYETFRAVSIGVFLTATAQGFVATIGFLIAGIRLPFILGIATGLVSLLGASFIITIPAALLLMMENSTRGLFLLLWGAIAVGWLDNLLKPILIGSRARMPFFLVFFSILGGLKMYGLLGLILGPILVASVLSFIRIYKEAYGS